MNWDQFWVGPWTFLTSVLFVKSYTALLKERIGAGLTNIFITSKKGYTYCYFQHEERKKLAEHVISSIIRQGKLTGHIAMIKTFGDELYEYVLSLHHKEITLQEFHEFVRLFQRYNGPHITMRNTSDFLDEQKDITAMEQLREARIYTEKVYKATEDFIHDLGKQFSRKTGYSDDLLLTMLPEEVEQYFASGNLPSKKILEQRYHHAAVHVEGKKVNLFLGDEAQEMEDKIHGPIPNTVVCGQIAYSGEVTGKVRVILNPKQFSRFDKGDILVTGMTRPDFLPFMEKAAAIVTDGGGMLSHAAITARELKKPCVIGTKSATRVFRDGEMVHVDAMKGEVMKL